MSYSQSQSSDLQTSTIQYFKHQQSHNKSKTNNQSKDSGFKDSQITYKQKQNQRKPFTVFEKLYEKAQERLNRLKTKIIDSEKKKEETYSFVPQTNRNKNKHLQSNVIERGELWMESRKKSQVNAEQQEMLKKMKDCTFTPRLNRKANDIYCLRKQNRQKSANIRSKSVSPNPRMQSNTDRSKTPRVKQKLTNNKSYHQNKNSLGLLTPRKHSKANAQNEDFQQVKMSLRNKIQNFNM